MSKKIKAPKTLWEKFMAALEKRGEKQVETRARGIAFTRAKGGFYFLGSAGSLRLGTSKTSSVPCSDDFKKLLIASLEAP